MNTTAELPQLPAIVDGVVAHRRRGQRTHAFRHAAHQWLVDLDEIPVMPWYLRPFAGFDVGDHLFGATEAGSPDIKTNLRNFLADNGVELGTGSRVVMLANARAFGHVFDPLSVFWCFAGDGNLQCLVAEVHNTYSQRHAYLLNLDAAGNVEVDKQFYVSPFNDVSGRYRMHFEVGSRRLAVRISLLRTGLPPFDATFAGAVLPATRRTVARLALRRPAMPQKVSILIRLHGVRLWLKGLRISPRPTTTTTSERRV